MLNEKDLLSRDMPNIDDIEEIYGVKSLIQLCKENILVVCF